MNVYLDHNATTPLAPEALEAMQPYLTARFGNASSMYALGREAKKALDTARAALADMLGAAEAQNICFTGSGTEADNLAVQGAARAMRNRGRHIITSAVEHSAVLKSCSTLEEEGFEVTYVKPDATGMIKPDSVAAAIRDDTILISIMHANNETGTINPVAEIGKIAGSRSILFHVDAVQSFCKVPFTVDSLNADLLSISSHKVQGPKGVGALYIREGVSPRPLIVGGHQEDGLRAGTENIAGIVGLVAAAGLEHSRQDADMKRTRSLRDRLEEGLLRKIPETRLNGHPVQRLPNTVNLSFPYVEAESLLLELDLRGVAVSSGSACMSGSGEPSHVLLAMGIPPELCRGSLRFSLGSGNTEDEINYVLEILPGIVERIRAMSPLAS
jgi:cysteine desulfurase